MSNSSIASHRFPSLLNESYFHYLSLAAQRQHNMQPSVVIQYLFYFISITLHFSYAVMVGIFTHKGLLVEFSGNFFLIFLGTLGGLLLSALFVYTLQRHWRTGRFAAPDVQLAFIFLYMLCELFFAGIEFSGNKDINCQPDPHGHPSPCSLRPLIFGFVFTAGIMLAVYFFAMLLGRFTCPTLLSMEGPEKTMESGRYVVHELQPIPTRKPTTDRHYTSYPPTVSRSGGLRRDRRPPNIEVPSNKRMDVDVPRSPAESSIH